MDLIDKMLKEQLRGERYRTVVNGFGWVDHRLVRDSFIDGLSCRALALYLFLVTVSDGEGHSYWSVRKVAERLGLTPVQVKKSRIELEKRELVVYEPPDWYLLALPPKSTEVKS
jgi:hypothetical protein